MSAPPALRTGRESPLRRSYARRGISCCRPVCAPPAPRTGRESPLRRRFTSERMTRRGCRPLPVLRLPGGHKSRISRRVCQLPAGSLLQRQTIPQPEPCGSVSSLYTREPAMRKKPARRATEDKRSDWQVDKCARGARTSKQGLCPPRLWRHEPQTKYNEEPPAKPVSFFPPFYTEGACPLFAHAAFLLIGTSLFLNPRTIRGAYTRRARCIAAGSVSDFVGGLFIRLPIRFPLLRRSSCMRRTYCRNIL